MLGGVRTRMNRGHTRGLAVVVCWEDEPVGRHYLLTGQQITVGSGRAADLRIEQKSVRRCQPLLQAGADGFLLLLPPGGRAVCRAVSPCPAGVYRAPERRVFEAGEHLWDEQALSFDHETRVSITVGPWHLSVRPTRRAPDWAEHSPQVVAQGFKQSLTWHHDRQAQLKRGAPSSRARCWPFVLLSGVLHAAALALIFAVPPETICLCFDRFNRDTHHFQTAQRPVIRTSIDLAAHRPTIRTSVTLEPLKSGLESPLNDALRGKLRAALRRHRSFLRSCIPGCRWCSFQIPVLLEADGRGQVTRAEVRGPQMLGPAARACMQAALRRWELPAIDFPLEVLTWLELG
jgi:hypothetical protein